MLYTTLAGVKAEARIKTNGDDSLITSLIETASRTLDRLVTGQTNLSNYFELGNVSNEQILGLAGTDGSVLCSPNKSAVNSVSAFSCRLDATQTWTALMYMDIVGRNTLKGYGASVPAGRVFVNISYNGGHAATAASLPADIVEATNLLTIRLYREGESGMSDSIGLAESGSISYTKAFPARLQAIINYWRRVTPIT